MADSTIGIVGLGGMGQLHAGNVADHGGEVIAGADVIEGAREEFAEAFDAATYEDYEEMYDAAEPDGVVITTPNTFHEPAATAALERNIDVLCEKPLADTLDAAESIADAAHGSDAFCMVGFHNRFSVAGELFTEHRENGRFGEIRHVEANFIRRRGIPGLGSWFTDRDLSGGGALIDIGVHAIDFALYLAGYPDVAEVSGTVRTDFGDTEAYADPDDWAGNWRTDEEVFDVDDSANAFIRCANGATIALDVAWATNREPEREFVARGTEAGARCDLGGDSLHLYETDTAATDHYVDTGLEGSLDPSGHEAEDIAFLEGIETGERPEINRVEEGLTVQRVIDAIYRSSEEGGAVQL
ncbi:MAG: Gfo/Idh/MocA family protein [Halobacteriales archaeon]